jgi:succinate-semialdehyde dehydrogenase/glutarate-semialdehyde dehydrogenase
MEALVADAVAQGATVLTGGKRIDRPGYFFEPTVLADVPMMHGLCMKSRLDPLPIRPFDTLTDGLEEANRLPYALSAYAFTRDVRTAMDVGDGLEAGMIGINQYRIVATELPFGGMKESGIGSEGGREGIAIT